MKSSGHTFVVEQAGCKSCAARVRDALAPLTTVHSVEVDADADAATVRVDPDAEISEAAVNRALTDASHGSGHVYRVKPGSWRSTL
jgi:copper chaperone CopZ